MNTRGLLIFTVVAGLAAITMTQGCASNKISAAEQQDGFVAIFDGKSLDGWQSRNKPELPSKGWEVKNGVLTVLGAGGGDVITKEIYSNFVLKLDFRLTDKANSGIKYLFDPKKFGGTTMEFQVLDAAHPDATRGRDGNRTVASLYDVMPAAADKTVKPVGEWNAAMLVVKGMHVEHWLNGQKVLEFERGSDAFNAAVAKSKFKRHAGWGTQTKGHVLLQDHGDRVSYRNIRIKELK